MKIAVVTDNGIKISSHFGTAPSYRVFTIEEGAVISDEMIEKPHHAEHEHGHGDGEGHDAHDHHHGHGNERGHRRFFQPIQDCQVLIAGGMGEPAHKGALSFGLEVILTGGKIEDALAAYLNGRLESDSRRVHSSHKSKNDGIITL